LTPKPRAIIRFTIRLVHSRANFLLQSERPALAGFSLINLFFFEVFSVASGLLYCLTIGLMTSREGFVAFLLPEVVIHGAHRLDDCHRILRWFACEDVDPG
ncbi:MAG: hypothetical protein KBH41_18685, partial [Azonexus sp.]|nr:hypothetical protein [Azonexus sp.]